MRRLLCIASFVLTLMALTVPMASADPDPDLTPGAAFTLSCEDGDHPAVVLAAGIHLSDSNSIFAPKNVELLIGGEWVLVQEVPGMEKSAVDLMHCSWVGPTSGRHFRADGILTPAKKS